MVALFEQHPPQFVQLVEVPARSVSFLRQTDAELHGDDGSMGARGRAHVTAMLNAKGGAWYILRSSTAFQGRPAAVVSAACSPLAASLPLAAAGGGADPVTKSSSPRRGSKKARTARFDNSRNAMRYGRMRCMEPLLLRCGSGGCSGVRSGGCGGGCRAAAYVPVLCWVQLSSGKRVCDSEGGAAVWGTFAMVMCD